MSTPTPPFPALCRFTTTTQFVPDPIFSMAGRRGGFPAVALAVESDAFRLVVSASGDQLLVDRAQVTFGMRSEAAFAVMDALEEAIEDARDNPDSEPSEVEHLENTLALIERCLDDDEQH